MGNLTRRNRRTPSLFSDDFFNSFLDDFTLGWDKPTYTRNRSSWTTGGYPVNVKNTDEGLVYQIAMPGLSKSDIDVEASENRLTVSTSVKNENKKDDSSYLIREFNVAKSTQSFYLPEGVNLDKIDVSYEAGILTLLVPQTENATVTRKIKIS